MVADAARAEVEAEVTACLGPTGFVSLTRVDQGALLSLSGQHFGEIRERPGVGPGSAP